MQFNNSSAEIDLINNAIHQVAQESGVDPRVILCIIMQESGGNPRVAGVSTLSVSMKLLEV